MQSVSSKSWWFLVKKCWWQQNSRSASSDLYIVWILFKEGIIVSSFFIVEYVWQILRREVFLAPLIRKQLRKVLSWIGLTWFSVYWLYMKDFNWHSGLSNIKKLSSLVSHGGRQFLKKFPQQKKAFYDFATKIKKQSNKSKSAKSGCANLWKFCQS